MRRYNQVINIEKVIDVVEVGVTEPVRCSFDGDRIAIVKYPRNRFGPYILINEWIGNRLGDEIDLTIPGFGLCYLSQEVVLESECDEIDVNNAGYCFFSEYIHNTVPLNSQIISKSKDNCVERVMLFDVMLDDRDRHNGNIITSLSPPVTNYYIDCSHIMTANGYLLNRRMDLKSELSDERILDVSVIANQKNNIYDILCGRFGFDTEKLYSEAEKIRNNWTKDLFDDIRSSIPTEWINTDTTTRINDMFCVLTRKVELLYKIVENLIRERENS